MRSLVNDIRSAARGERLGDPLRALREAVVEHLRELCSTPRGSVLLSDAYGVEDPTQIFHEYPTSITDLERDLEELILRFEPRLVNVSVTHVQAGDLELALRFDIQGSLVSEGRVASVRFSTVIDSNNHVRLQ